MKTLPHPTHDRYLTRWFAAGASLATLSFILMLCGDNSPAGDWRTWLGALGFTGGIFLPWLGFRYCDRTHCPQCGAPLVREYGCTTFHCQSCEVSWETGWSGGG